MKCHAVAIDNDFSVSEFCHVQSCGLRRYCAFFSRGTVLHFGVGLVVWLHLCTYNPAPRVGPGATCCLLAFMFSPDIYSAESVCSCMGRMLVVRSPLTKSGLVYSACRFESAVYTY